MESSCDDHRRLQYFHFAIIVWIVHICQLHSVCVAFPQDVNKKYCQFILYIVFCSYTININYRYNKVRGDNMKIEEEWKTNRQQCPLQRSERFILR